MSTNLERMEDDIRKMVENIVDEIFSENETAAGARLSTLEDVLAKAVLDIAKVERFIAFLGPLALLSERLTRCEGLLVHHGLDIETNSMNVLSEPPAETAALALYGGEQ